MVLRDFVHFPCGTGGTPSGFNERVASQNQGLFGLPAPSIDYGAHTVVLEFVNSNFLCFPSDVCYFVQGNITCLLVAGSPIWKRVQY